MVKIGYALSSEEQNPINAVKWSQRAEEAGFSFMLISDHFHPWIDAQGESPFVWAVLGGIAQTTKRIQVGTGVTCPLIRIHPTIIAQAAATVNYLMEGRFFLGVGTGENLNEHIVGMGWPTIDIRQQMLEEAIDIIRTLWQGGNKTYYGNYYTVEDARIYSLPKIPPPIYVAAAGKQSLKTAIKFGDGLISTSPDKKLLADYSKNGGMKKPKYGQLTICYHQNEAEAIKIAYRIWPTGALKGQLSQELRIPTYFEQAVKMLHEEDVAQATVCGPDKHKHIQAIQQYIDAGFDYIYIHQVGHEQEGFFKFYEKEILPHFQ